MAPRADRVLLRLTPLFLLASCSGAPQAPAPAPWIDRAPEPVATPVALPDSAPPPPAAVPAAEPLAKTGAEAAAKPAPTADTRPRLGATDHFAYIYSRPAKEGLPLGYVRTGTSVPLKSAERVEGKGCPRGFYAVEPRGYVCLEHRTTLNLEDPYFKALAEVSPPADAVFPYKYAFSNGAPMYSRVPTPEEQEKAEKNLGPRGSFVQLAEWSKGHEELLTTEPIVAEDPVPALFEGQRTIYGGTRNPKTLVWRVIPNGSLLAYAKSFEAAGRVWLVTSDLMLVPADRVRKVKRSSFRGVDLGDGLELPLAWNRSKGPKPKYTRAEGGELTQTGSFPAKSPLPISTDKIVIGKKVYYEVRGEPGVLVAEDDVTVARARTELPRGVGPGERWLEAKILPGTLTAYEGLRPVRSTLFSPGKGGVPVPGHDHTKYATTAVGYFPIEWKDRVATMSNEKNGEPKVLWFSDVPNIQYLRAPLAMHVAYWHEDYGNPKSAECVNVSPEDGKWLFGWTLPQLPEGWGGMRPGSGNGRSTPVVISAL
jgi:hypothetical protein